MGSRVGKGRRGGDGFWQDVDYDDCCSRYARINPRI